MHLGGLGHREDAGDRHFQPAVANAAQYMLHAILPGRRAGIDMAESVTDGRCMVYVRTGENAISPESCTNDAAGRIMSVSKG